MSDLIERKTLTLGTGPDLRCFFDDRLDVLVVSTAWDEIGRDFNAPGEALGWTVSAYVLTRITAKNV